jgi:hypothetical protein
MDGIKIISGVTLMRQERSSFIVVCISFVMRDICDGPNLSVPTNTNLLAVERDVSPEKLKA